MSDLWGSVDWIIFWVWENLFLFDIQPFIYVFNPFTSIKLIKHIKEQKKALASETILFEHTVALKVLNLEETNTV